MHATKEVRARVLFNGAAFDALVEPLGLTTFKTKAEQLGGDGGNLSRIYRGQPVSAEFIARVVLAYPKVPFEKLFRAEVS